MCGICGIAYTDHSRHVHLPQIEAMCAAMHYRGPDEDGFLLNDNVGMGMRRLSIIDLSTGKQPIFNEDGSIGIIYNGEIYNYQSLRQDLITRGHTFRTHSDTETIVHAYEEFGTDFLGKLNGMFAFAIWDNRQKRLFIARDRTGQKPIFYHHTSDHLIFGSEIKTLLCTGDVPKTINQQAIYHYLSTQYVPGPETIFENVYQLPAGSFAVWQDGELTVEHYWQPNYAPKPDYPANQWIRRTRQIVTEAVERHMVSDVPIGAYLSGGVDSSIVVSQMAKFAPGKVKTFSIGFDIQEYSETDHAQRIAKRFNTDHQVFIVTADEVLANIDHVVYHAGQPLADTSLMATSLLAKMTREHVTVALTGDGGDEAFGGYTRYALDRLLRIYRVLPESLRTKAMPAMASLLPERSDIPTDRNIVTGLKRLAQASTTSHKSSILAWGSYFTEAQKHAIGCPEWLNAASKQSTSDWLAEIYDSAVANNRLDRTLASDFVTYLQDDLLVKADRMSMGHSLETRAPFLDNEVLALALPMPQNMKIRGATQKWVLREAFKDELPSENVKRIKRGFGTPVASWIRGQLSEQVRDILLTDRANRGYFRQSSIKNLIDNHMSGKVDHGQRIWALYVLELWHRQYVDS